MLNKRGGKRGDVATLVVPDYDYSSLKAMHETGIDAFDESILLGQFVMRRVRYDHIESLVFFAWWLQSTSLVLACLNGSA